MTEKWMPSAVRIQTAMAGGWPSVEALIREAVEKAVAEERARWTAALKGATGEAESGPGFRELYEKAESTPDYWATLLRMGREAYDKATARHASDIERAVVEEKAKWLELEKVTRLVHTRDLKRAVLVAKVEAFEAAACHCDDVLELPCDTCGGLEKAEAELAAFDKESQT